VTEAVLAQKRSARRRAIGIPVARLGWVGMASAVVIVLLALMAIFAPLIAPHDPNAIDLLHPFAPSSGEHLLGTDDTGRDIFSRLILGSRTSLLGPLLVVLLEVLVGVPIALAAAWRGGFVDGVISRVLDVLFAFPGILLAILVLCLLG
jgi:peptide/nickel transport system permease protein